MLISVHFKNFKIVVINFMVTFLIVLSVYSLFLTLRFKNFTLKNYFKSEVQAAGEGCQQKAIP